MKEITGDIICYIGESDAICFTSNGITKSNGEAVMGRGVALSFKQSFRDLPKLLGRSLIEIGNHTVVLKKIQETSILAFPTKYDWRNGSDIELIKQSAKELMSIINENNWTEVILPRPGCENGGLIWGDVKEELKEILDDRVSIITI